MAFVDSVVSVALHTTQTADAFALAGMRGGHHFDVVFSGHQKTEAAQTIVAWLRRLEHLHQEAAALEDRTPPNATDVYVQLRVVGVWMERTDTTVSGRVRTRLFIEAQGWSFQGEGGVERTCGDLETSLEIAS